MNNLIPEKLCLSCDVCCRYTENSNQWTPFILKEELPRFESFSVLPPFVESCGLNIEPVKDKNNYICPFFIPLKNRCRIYSKRPLDCRLYPFVINYNRTYSRIILSCDRQCPFAADKKNTKKIEKYARSLKDALDTEEMVEAIYLNRGLIMPYNDSFLRMLELSKATRKIFKGKFGLKAITIDDRFIFNEFINRARSKTYAYNFAHIYCWKDIAHISWKVVDDNLLVFWIQGDDCFLLLPPLGKRISDRAIEYMKKICAQADCEPI
ncbi:MAG: YkgJ family cysteine cluster protein, partial [Candidatus Omnitrophica bacterium]|nr:YkgJ family cysteine cluster protein [Candidatus Omnitrophota bacterium]